MGTKYMLLGIALVLCGIAFAINNPIAYVSAVAGLVLAFIGLFKEG